jgi:hypothetical protein
MEIGELKSNSLEELFKREAALVEKFNNYCRQHSKNLSTEFTINSTSAGATSFSLKFKIENTNGNNGETTGD